MPSPRQINRAWEGRDPTKEDSDVASMQHQINAFQTKCCDSRSTSTVAQRCSRRLLNSAVDWVSSELPPRSYCVRNAMRNEDAYIDTSVLGAYYCPELLSAAAEDALRLIEKTEGI
jgi:hypothetical protein